MLLAHLNNIPTASSIKSAQKAKGGYSGPLRQKDLGVMRPAAGDTSVTGPAGPDSGRSLTLARILYYCNIL